MFWLIVISVLLAISGFLFRSEATTGVVLVGLACFLGILARISQASKHPQEIKDILKKDSDYWKQ